MVSFDSLSTFGKVTFILNYIQLIEAIVGIVGNVFVFIVFSRRRMRHYTFSFYSRVRAISDNLLLFQSFRNFAAGNLDADINVTSNFMCKMMSYLPPTIGSISVWLLAIIALDRLLTIVYPNRFNFIRLKRTQFITVIAIFIYSFCLHTPAAIYTNLLFIPQGNFTLKLCIIDDPSEAQTFNWISIINQMFVIFGLNNILAALMIFNIYKSRGKFKVDQHNKENKTAKKDRRFAINSIVLNLKCFLSKAPLLVTAITLTYIHDLTFETFNLIFTACINVYIIDNLSPFFLNLIFNKLFYNEFVSMFKPDRINRVDTNGSTIVQSSKLNLFKMILITQHFLRS